MRIKLTKEIERESGPAMKKGLELEVVKNYGLRLIKSGLALEMVSENDPLLGQVWKIVEKNVSLRSHGIQTMESKRKRKTRSTDKNIS